MEMTDIQYTFCCNSSLLDCTPQLYTGTASTWLTMCITAALYSTVSVPVSQG